jgi:hypothetical protein
VGPTLQRPAQLSIFCLAIEGIAFISTSVVVQEPKKTFTDKRVAHSAPWEMPELDIRERPPSTLRNIDGGPLGGARAIDPRVPTINAKKH